MLKTLGAAAFALAFAAACGVQPRAELTPVSGDAFMGSPDAPVVVVEYGSPTCPGCKSWHDQYWQPMKSTYVDTGKVKFVFRELAVHGAIDAAIFSIARCVGPDEYFGVINEAFSRQADIVGAAQRGEGAAAMQSLGAQFRLSPEQVEACIDDPANVQRVIDVQTESRARGVTSTPTFLVNDRLVADVRFEALASRIDAALEGEPAPADAPATHEGHDHAAGESH